MRRHLPIVTDFAGTNLSSLTFSTFCGLIISYAGLVRSGLLSVPPDQPRDCIILIRAGGVLDSKAEKIFVVL